MKQNNQGVTRVKAQAADVCDQIVDKACQTLNTLFRASKVRREKLAKAAELHEAAEKQAAVS